MTHFHYLRCSRCGEFYYSCRHVNTWVDDMNDAEAERTKARYALGQLHNPDHDITGYRDPGKVARAPYEIG